MFDFLNYEMPLWTWCIGAFAVNVGWMIGKDIWQWWRRP